VFYSGFRRLRELGGLGTIPGDEAIQVVAIRPIGLKERFIKKALSPTAEAHLVGVFLCTDGPTHFAMPAPAKNHDGSARNTRSEQAQRPDPTRLLLLLTHNRTQNYLPCLA